MANLCKIQEHIFDKTLKGIEIFMADFITSEAALNRFYSRM